MQQRVSEITGENFVYNHVVYTEPDQKRFTRHVNNELELIFFLKGSATYIIEDKKYKLKRGDLVIIRPSKYHYVQIDENTSYERYNLLFPVSLIGKELLRQIPDDVEVISCENDSLIFDIFKRADMYSGFGEKPFFDLIGGLMKELFYNLVYTGDEDVSTPTTLSPTVSRALEYINENIYTIKDIEEVCRALFITEAYFFRIFKDHLKISPKKYITNKRLITAKKLLDRGEKPTTVYQKCGFNTYTAFYKRYVEFFGSSPSEK